MMLENVFQTDLGSHCPLMESGSIATALLRQDSSKLALLGEVGHEKNFWL